MNRMLTWTILAMVLSTLNVPAQSTLHVDASAAPGGNGSQLAPFMTLAEAVAAAASGDSLLLAPGSYEGGNIDLGQRNLSITGTSGAATTEISNLGGGSGSFKIGGPAAGVTKLIDLTFSNGGANRSLIVEALDTGLEITGCLFVATAVDQVLLIGGGGNNQNPLMPPSSILIDGCVFEQSSFTLGTTLAGASAVIKNSEFKDHHPGYCIGNSIRYDSVLVDNCHFHDGWGRALTIHPSNSTTVSNCLVEDYGCGGIWLYGPNSTITNSTFRRCFGALQIYDTNGLVDQVEFEDCNYGIRHYGLAGWVVRSCDFHASVTTPTPGILQTSGDLVVERCRFEGLNSTQGAAIHAEAALFLNDSTFRNCRAATGTGGAVFVGQTFFAIANCSFVANTAVLGAALHVTYGAQGEVVNSIFRGASSSLIAGAPALSHCNVEGGWAGPGSGNFSGDPLFVDAPNGDLHLMPGSPCIDAGDVDIAGLSAFDLDGDPRVQGNYVDVGADETTAAASTLAGTSDDFVMVAKKNNQRINAGSSSVTGGDVIALRISSPQHGLDGFPVYVMGELFSTGGSPILPVGHPAIHLNLGAADVLFDPSLAIALPGWAFGLPSSGLDLVGPVPYGFAGNCYRLQAFMLAPVTLNAWYAATNAVDLVHF